LLALLALIDARTAVAQVGWAQQAAGFNINGAITVNALSGGSYASTVNPSGVVAKPNQNAVTQSPTVIIQATGSTYAQTYPMIVSGTNVPPTCPTGYTSVFTSFGTGQYSGSPVFNVAGTRHTFGGYTSNGGNYVGFGSDNSPAISTNFPLYSVGWLLGVASTTAWAANLCTK
jgi:hypothetical protein